MQSTEYPDLAWMPPKSWTNANRTSVQLIVIHTTEGSAQAQSAEDGASYDQRRTDGTSTHYFHDSNSTVQCVLTNDQAHTARAQGNRRGIHHELCARSALIDWTGPYALSMLRVAARQAARDAKKWDIPVRKLSAGHVASGMKGFCGHADITAAFPQDKGTHTDPGVDFPWPVFLRMVDLIVNPPPKESIVATQFNAEDVKVINAPDVLTDYTDALGGKGSPAGRSVLNSGYPRHPGDERTALWENLQALQSDLDQLKVGLDEIRVLLTAPPV